MKLSFELFLELSNCKTYLNLWKLQVDWDQFQFHLSEFGKVFLCDDQIEGSVVVRGSKKQGTQFKHNNPLPKTKMTMEKQMHLLSNMLIFPRHVSPRGC